MNEPCQFIVSLAEALREDPIRGKYLLAPSHRVGRQWLDQAARVTGGFANARSVTVRRLIHDHAEPELRRRGLRAATWPETVRLVGVTLDRIAGESGESGYFTTLPPSMELAEALAAGLEELEAAGVMSAASLARCVTPPEKAAELVKLIRFCRGARMRAGLAGLGDVHAAALEGLSASGSDLPMLLLPAAMGDDFSAMEWAFISRWPEESRRLLAEEAVGERVRPRGARRFTADCAANEARETLRRIQAGGLPLDSVEIICVDPGSSVPALCSAGLEMFGGTVDELPMTFHSGLPAFLARPGRLLGAWLEWLEQGLPAEGLARMVDSGLIPAGWSADAPSVSAAVLASRIRALPVNGDPEEYRRALSRGGDDALGDACAWLARLFGRIVPLAGGVPALSDSARLLGAADVLFSLPCPDDSRLDAYAKSALLEAVRMWGRLGDWRGFNPSRWLGGLSAGVRVMGLGPLPGMLHVGDLSGGGHSGRPNVFIVGLDDSRFPGSAAQDPVLADRERAGISPQLRGSGRRAGQRVKSLERILARSPGEITMSHARLDAASGRQLFPAAVFAGQEGDDAPADAVLAPATAEKCLNRKDDWLWMLLGRGMAAPAWSDVGEWFPDLARGRFAREARASAAFTEYDGNVPEAGRECDPASGRVFSPTDLELFAACPMDYFFKRVLAVRPPDRHAPAPGRWLDGGERGSLLHDLFQDFLDDLQRRGETLTDATRARHLALLREMLDQALAKRRRELPPADSLAHRREVGEMREAADIFFLAEERRREFAEPLHREVRLGGGGGARTPWDREEPVAVRLRSGGTILCAGRVDRVDRLDGGGLLILDYKTGSSGKYSPSEPFRQGRNLQPFLYSVMLEQALSDLGRPERVRRFEYFFPMPRDEGRVIAYERADLTDGGMVILDRVSRMLARGCFPFTAAAADAEYSDYAPIYGDAGALAAGAGRKMEADPGLADWAALRAMDV